MVFAAEPDGADLYAKHCAACHETLTVLQNRAGLKAMSPDVALSDVGLIPALEGIMPDPKVGGGLFAIQLTTGEMLWKALPPEGGCKTAHLQPGSIGGCYSDSRRSVLRRSGWTPPRVFHTGRQNPVGL